MQDKEILYTVTKVLLPPQMPDFIQYEKQAGKKQDGFNPSDQGIPISELSEADALNYAELMRQTFMKHWAASQEGRS